VLRGIDQATLNLLVALLLGAAIGFERQWRQRLAGLRTNALVDLGAATFVMFAGLFPGEASPTRVAGFLAHALLATVLVIGVKLLLRPAMGWVNRRLPAESDQAYAVSVVCRGADEAHVRVLLLQGLATGDMHLVELESANIEGSDRVSVAAALRADKRNDAVLERVVGRLSLEPAVTSGRWRVNGDTPT
jgi:putative Mg2+ transporter-C (MgtC) family protein